MSITVALYSHDSVGLGHARRNRAVAYALAADLPRLTGQTVGGLLIAGHPDAAGDSLPEGWDWLVLPGYARTSSGYASRRMHMDVDQLTEMRSSAVAAALEAISPDLFIADRHPFGVGGELTEALRLLREDHRCATVLGMRDVLDTPSVAAAEWEAVGGAEAVATHYDALWIYGDQNVYDPLATGEIPSALASRSRSTGYLSHGRPSDPGSPGHRPYVLTMVGGGSDGGRLARAAAEAEIPAGHRHLIVTGPQMPQEDVAVVRAAAGLPQESEDSPLHGEIGEAGEDVVVLRSAANVPALVAEASAVVCMGGYNSVAEVMATSTPALVVPRNARRAEQPRRAEALAAVGAVDTLPAEEINPTHLSTWFAGAVDRRVERSDVDLDGLTRLGRLAAELIAPRPAMSSGHFTAAVSAEKAALAEISTTRTAPLEACYVR